MKQKFIFFLILKQIIVSDCVGVQWIGFALTAFGLSGSLGALIIGRMIRYVPQFIAVYGSFLLTVGLALFLIFWERKPSFLVVFGFAISWGLAECVLMTLGPGTLVIIKEIYINC